MSEQGESRAHPGPVLYVVVAAFLALMTAMELTVFYLHALKPVLVPVLLILSAAKFSLVAMFYMHLRYDSRILAGIFAFPLVIALTLVVALLMLFTYLSYHLAPQ
jgi:cytochrome c oxidase subunit IV